MKVTFEIAYIFSESGVSHDPCSDTYCGTAAFSEIEVCTQFFIHLILRKSLKLYYLIFQKKVQNIKAYVEGMNPKPVLGHCMHSYSQLWLWPYGYAYFKIQRLVQQNWMKNVVYSRKI